jgi:hypothetical protein
MRTSLKKNRRQSLACWIALLTASSFCARSATYYVAITGVDLNPGTQALPWRTIQQAANNALSGDTVLVGSGNYGEIVSFQNGGSPANYITFDGQGVATNIQFQISRPYIKIRNFYLTGLTTKYSGVIQFNLGGHAAYIEGNYIDCGYADSVRAFNWDFGSVTPIDPNAASGVTITNNIAEHVYNTPCVMLFGTNNSILHNTLRTIRDADYFYLFGISNVVCANSCIGFEDTTNSGNHMDCVQTFGNNSHASKYMRIERNIFGYNFNPKDVDIAQVCQLEQDGDLDIHDWDIRNNVFYNLLKGECGIPSVRWHNNVFYQIWTNSAGGALILNWSADGRNNATNCQILNNVFLECGYGDSQSGWYNLGDGSGTITNTWIVDYNYVAGTNGTAKNAGLPRTNQRWYEPHGVNGGDAKFYSAALRNFHVLNGSPLVDVGTNLTSLFNNDLDGHVRPIGPAFDIGAYELNTLNRPSAPANLRLLGQ